MSKITKKHVIPSFIRTKIHVNPRRFTAKCPLKLWQLEEACYVSNRSASIQCVNGIVWRKWRCDRLKIAMSVEQVITQRFGTADVLKLLSKCMQSSDVDELLTQYVDSRLEKNFALYMQRASTMDLSRFFYAQQYPSETIGYFIYKVQQRYLHDCTAATYLDHVVKQLESRNMFALLPHEECLDSVSESFVPCISSNKVHRIFSRQRVYDDLTNLVDEHKPLTFPVSRDKTLLDRLRRIIRRLVAQRTNSIEADEYLELGTFVNNEVYRETVEPQMMEPVVETKEEGPVILTNAEEIKHVEAITDGPELFWANASTSDKLVNETHSSEMEILLNNFTWSNSDSIGKVLYQVDLPVEAIRDNMSHPAAMYALQYAYWMTGLKLRVHVNTTPMMVGKLICFWHYSAKYDVHYKNRVNIANAVQFPNEVFNASSGEDVCLSIPFRSFRSFLSTRPREDDSSPMYMGTFYIMVFNTLLSQDTTTDVSGYVHVQFTDSKYSGMLTRSTVVPEMFSIPRTIQTAEKALHLVNSAINMDKPPVPAVPSFMQPTYTSSLASGVHDISTINAMRLDPSGQTQHPAGSSTPYSETRIDIIKRIPGLLAQVIWSTSNSRGFELFSIPATLAQPFSNYPQTNITVDGTNLVAAVLPPVCMLADIHSFNRGSFEIIFEIVNSRFHTGACLAAYTPAVHTQSLETAVQSYNMTLDCGSTSRYVLRVPYISERPLAPRYNKFDGSNTSKIQSNGIVGLYVLNPLRATTTSTRIMINIYIRGTDETEFMCLTAPSFSVINDIVKGEFPELSIIPNNDGTIGCGTWRYANDIQKNMGVMRYGPGSDHVMQFPGIKSFTVYKANFQGADTGLCKFALHYIGQDGKITRDTYDFGNPLYIARLIVNNDGDKYSYAIPFSSIDYCKAYCAVHSRAATNSNPHPNSPTIKAFPKGTLYVYGVFQDGEDERYFNYANVKNIVFVPEATYFKGQLQHPNAIEPQMDTVARTHGAATVNEKTGRLGIKALLPMQDGMRLFGERFSDLKDYTRRFQIYCNASTEGKITPAYALRVPLLPLGLSPVSNSEVIREGLIPYINSNYAFFRGGMILKIMVSSSVPNDDSIFYYQHKFDIHETSRIPLTNGSPDNVTHCLLPAYATVTNCLRLNSTITMEIPAYISTNLLLAQRSNLQFNYEVINSSLGVLDIFKLNPTFTTAKYSFVIWYALADDFDYSCYIGLPPVVPIVNIKKKNLSSFEIIEPQSDANPTHTLNAQEPIVEEPNSDDEPQPSTSYSVPAVVVPEDETEVNMDLTVDDQALAKVLQMNELPSSMDEQDFKSVVEPNSPLSYVKDKVSGFVSKSTKAEIRESLGLDPKSDDSYFQIIKDAIKTCGDKYSHIIISLTSQLVHYLRDPCIGTASICIVTLLAHFGFATGFIMSAANKLCRLFRKDYCEPQSSGENESEESPKAVKKAFLSAIVATVAAKLGSTYDAVKHLRIPCFKTGMWENIRFGALTINSVITLLSNVCKIVPIVWNYLVKYLNPLNWFRYMFYKDKDITDRWIQDVNEVLDPRNAEKVHSDPQTAVLLQTLVLIGKEISIRMSRISQVSAKEYHYIRHLNIELNRVYTELIMSNSASGIVRAEPYCFAVHGASQVGKTHNAKDVAEYALSQSGYCTYSDPTYVRQPGAPFWTGVLNQPICVIEDFLQFETGPNANSDIYDLIHLVSNQMFQPPQAEISRKHIRFSPLIVALTMNKGYTKVDGLGDNNAWMNRRHDLFYFYKDSSYENVSPKYMSADVQKHRSYLRVKKQMYNSYRPAGHTRDVENVEAFYEKVSVPNFSDTGEIQKDDDGNVPTYEREEMTYYQFRWYVATKFAAEYKRIILSYQSALERLSQFWPEGDDGIKEKLKCYYDKINELRWELPEHDKVLLSKCAGKLSRTLCDVCHHYKNSCICEGTNWLNTSIAKNILKKEDKIAPQMNKIIRFPSITAFREDPPSVLKDPKYESVVYMLSRKFRNYNEVSQANRCLHYYIFNGDPIELNSYFEFYEKHFMFVNVKFDYPKIECCGNDHEQYFTLLTKIEMIQLQAGMLINPLPKPISFTPVPIRTFIIGKYKEYEKDYKHFVSAISKDTPWYIQFSQALMQMCASVVKLTLWFTGFVVIKDWIVKPIVSKVANSLSVTPSAYARLCSTHKPDERCQQGECPEGICGNMAYNPHKLKPKKVVPMQAQMALDMRINIESILSRNTFFIQAATPIKGTSEFNCYYVRCLGLKGNYFLGVDHYFYHFDTLAANTKFYFMQPSCCVEINYANLQIRNFKNSCMVIGCLPKTIPAFRNIVSKICSESRGGNLAPEGVLYELEFPPEVLYSTRQQTVASLYYNKTLHKVKFSFHRDTIVVPPILMTTMSSNLENYYKYNVGGKGKCGSVLISDTNTTEPIIGIHVAGNAEKTGYAECISRETFEQFFAQVENTGPSTAFNHIAVNNKDIVITPQINPTSILTGNFIPIGCVQSAYSHRPPPKSTQIHSECYNEITSSTYDFPILSPHDSRAVGSPMVLGCLHHTNPPEFFEDHKLIEAVDIVRDRILAFTSPCRLNIGPLSVDEVVVGIKGHNLYNALEFDTSEGFPFSSFRPKGAKDKKWLFDLSENEEGYTLHDINPMLRDAMQQKHNIRLQNEIPLTIFIDCLKDIKVPAEKLQPRIFSVSPIDFTIQFKQYFSDFMVAYQEARFDVQSAIGINVDSMEWTVMVRNLLSNSPAFGCGDYSKFGPRLMSKVVLAAFDIINQWYDMHGDGSNNGIRTIMAHEITFAHHLMFNFVYQVLCGAPSGSAITTILNNVVNCIYIVYVWVSALEVYNSKVKYDVDTCHFSYPSFFRYVCLVCYGDDLIMTIKEDVLHIFNPKIIQEILAKYNIKFTDALKVGAQHLSLSVFDKAVSFLKRNIAPHPSRIGVYVAKMDRRALEETCNWIHKCADVREMSIVACQSMLLNAYGHGPLYYENLRKRVKRYWSKKNVDIEIPSWMEVDFRIFGNEDFFMIRRAYDAQLNGGAI